MKIEEIITQNNQDFHYFSEQEIKTLRYHSLIRSYKKGQVLFNPGDSRTHLFLLLSGVVKMEKSDSSGDFSYSHFIKKNGLFPRVGLFQDRVYSESATAHTDIEIVYISAKKFEQMIQTNPQQLIHWIHSQSNLLKINMTKIQKGTTNDAYERVITTLSILLNDLGDWVDTQQRVAISCPITINDIAKMSGTTRETASSIMKKLIKMNRISYSHKLLTFLDAPFFIHRLNN